MDRPRTFALVLLAVAAAPVSSPFASADWEERYWGIARSVNSTATGHAFLTIASDWWCYSPIEGICYSAQGVLGGSQFALVCKFAWNNGFELVSVHFTWGHYVNERYDGDCEIEYGGTFEWYRMVYNAPGLRSAITSESFPPDDVVVSAHLRW